MGNITSAGEGAPDTGFISAPHLRNVVAPFRDDCGSLANLEVTTTHVTGIDLSGLRTVEGALEIVGRHDGSSQLEHLDLRNLVAVFGYNCPTGFDGAASSSGGMGADGMDTPVTALPDAFKPDAASTDDFFAAWVEATANITDFIDYRGSAEVDPATFQPAPYQRSAPGGMEISKHPNLGPALDLGRLLFVNGDLVLRKLDAVVALELSGLRAVNGDVVVAENRALASLASLSNLLVVVDDIIVSDNAQLAALDLRELLILLGRLVVDHNPHLVYASAESMIAAHPPQVVCGLCWLAGAQICYDDTEYGACKRDGFAPEHKDLCDWSVEIGCGACFEHSSCSYRDEDMDMPTIQVEHNDALTTFAIQDLFSVGGSVSVAHNPSLLGLHFEELDRVFGQVVIAYNNALRFVAAPLLENIFGGVLVSQNNNLVAAVFPNLNTVFDLAYYYTTPAFVAVTENPRLELVDMSALHNVTGHVDIVSNPSLPLVQFQCLEQVDSLTCDPTQCECNNFNDAVSPQCLPPTKPCGTGLHSDDVVCAYGKISQGEDPIYSLAEVAAAGCKIAFQVDSTPEDDVGHISLPHLQATVEDFNVVGSYNLKSFEARSLVFVGDDLRLWNCDSSEFGGAEAEASDDEGTDLSSGRGRGCRYDMVLSSFDLSSLIAVDDVFYIEDLRQLSGTIDLGSLVSVGGEQLSIDQLNQRSGDDTAFIQQIDLCALKVVLGVFELEYLPMLKRVCLDSLVSVGRFEVDDNLSLVYLNLPELRVVSGGPYEDAFGSEQTRDLEIDNNLSLQFFGAPKLVLVAAEVEVQECPVLTTIQLPSLVLAGKIDIEQNDHLEIINLVSLKFVYPIGFLGTYDRKAQIDIVHNYALYDLDLHNLKSVADSLIINDSSIGCLFLPSLLSVATLPSPSCGRGDYYGLQLHNHSALYTFGAPELLTAGPTKYDCGRRGGGCCRCEAGIEVETEGQYTGSVLAEVNLQNVTTLATTSSEIEFNSNPVLPEVDMPCLERDGATVFCVDPTECFCKADFCERKSFVSCGTAVGPQGCPAVPTKAPTKAPTLPPKTRPTKSPTKSPTDDTRPTPKPTPMPTKRPTKSPTSGPPTKVRVCLPLACLLLLSCCFLVLLTRKVGTVTATSVSTCLTLSDRPSLIPSRPPSARRCTRRTRRRRRTARPSRPPSRPPCRAPRRAPRRRRRTRRRATRRRGRRRAPRPRRRARPLSSAASSSTGPCRP